MARKSKAATPERDEQAEKKAWLDDLLSKTKVSQKTAKKLHEANGTSGDTPAPAEKRTTGGHGPSTVTMPNFSDL